MAEAKDPAIKLFGKTIPLPEVAAAAAGNDSPSGATVGGRGGGGEDWVDQNRATNSSPEEDCVRAGEEGREVDKVRDWIGLDWLGLVVKGTHCLEEWEEWWVDLC